MANVMHAASCAIRGLIVAPPGKKLVISDLSNIEGRGLVWLANEQWKLQAFRDFDNGVGPDLYKCAYGKSFGIPPEEVTKPQRQIGKVQELACGYQGSLGAFVTFSLAYGIDLDDMADKAWPALPEDSRKRAADTFDWYVSNGLATLGLRTKTAIVILAFVQGWRAAHPEVVKMWKMLENLSREAIDSPGKTLTGGRFKFKRSGNWLRIRLPSGRFLCYPSPRVAADGKISYSGINQFNRQWCKIYTYGGKIAENATQSFSRDILYASKEPIAAAGYDQILEVHDEFVAEAPDSPEYNAEHLSSLLAAPKDFAPDMPLAAAGHEGYRYGKEG